MNGPKKGIPKQRILPIDPADHIIHFCHWLQSDTTTHTHVCDPKQGICPIDPADHTEGVNYSFEGRTGLGIFWDLLVIFWDLLEFRGFLGFFLESYGFLGFFL